MGSMAKCSAGGKAARRRACAEAIGMPPLTKADLIEALLPAILAMRGAGCGWSQVSSALGQMGFKASGAHLKTVASRVKTRNEREARDG